MNGLEWVHEDNDDGFISSRNIILTLLVEDKLSTSYYVLLFYNKGRST
jgi:hypothetical protein